MYEWVSVSFIKVELLREVGFFITAQESRQALGAIVFNSLLKTKIVVQVINICCSISLLPYSPPKKDPFEMFPGGGGGGFFFII